MRKLFVLTVAVACIAGAAAACSGSSGGGSTSAPGGESTTASPGSSNGATASGTVVATSTASTGDGSLQRSAHDVPGDYVWNDSEVTEIVLKGNSASASSSAVKVNGATVTVTGAGTFRLGGTLDDGQVVVDAGKNDVVRLILDGVDITNSKGAAIAVEKAARVVVILEEGSKNRLADGSAYVFPDQASDEPNATLFSKANLTIAGKGALEVTGRYNDGIATKDGLVIAGGTIGVDAIDDGIRGKDYIVVRDGKIEVKAGGDGLKADNEEDASLGYVAVMAGQLTITSGRDGIDAATDALIADGTIAINTGGGASGSLGTDVSAKGIKGTASVAIQGGDFDLQTADDALHSNKSVTIDGGAFAIATGDDAIHADETLVVNGGAINVKLSYEGLESAAVTVNGGDITIVSSDDGINAAGGVDGSGAGQPAGGPGGAPGMAPPQGGPGRDQFGGAAGDYSVAINGGTILVTASGDGIDANGTLSMSGGTLVIQGPTANNNGALDYDRSFELTGGLLVAAGSAGMAQGPGTGSTQASVHVRFASVQAAGSIVSIKPAGGEEVVTVRVAKAFQSLVVSSPKLVAPQVYDVYTGGSATGSELNGLFTGGSHSGGTKTGTATAALVIPRTGR